jgi:DNA-binding response OmpR family regulator
MLHVPNSDELRQRIEFLEVENLQLRRQLGIEPNNLFIRTAKDAFGVTNSQARVLQVLVVGKVRSTDALMYAYANGGEYPSSGCLKVQISKLRTKLAAFGIKVRNERAVGYSMAEDDRARACELLEAAAL